MKTDDDIPSTPLVRIVCAAIRHTNGTVIAGVRHYDSIMRATILQICEGNTERARNRGWYDCHQGFLTNTFEYVTREQAWRIAEAADQIRQITGSKGCLYSEDVW